MARTTVIVLTDAGGAHLGEYLKALSVTDEVESVIVADPSGDCEAAAKQTLGAKLKGFERDHAKALAGHQATLALVTMEAVKAPPVIHAALEANCHVLAEKPSCVKGEDFEPLVRLSEMKHRHLTLAFANRLRGTVQAARTLIESGQIGKIYGSELHIIADQTRLRSPAYQKAWFADRARSGGGHLIWLGIHWLDLIMHMTGSKIVEAAGFTGIVGGQPLKAEDSAAMALRFDNGSFGTITSGYYLDRGYHSHIKVWGSHGWLQLEPHGGEALQWFSTRENPAQVKKYDGAPDAVSYTPLVKACVRASLDLELPPVTGAECLHVLKTVFACYRAAETGQSQKIG
ncbi:MAG: Gfo/Idh/MocA family oxidoreductase [Chthoniobacteraceae bacterium]